ncbi:hypothetical protein GX865_01000 [Candidatus Saccharibacteria bacterium]|jgi:hypothetical protein|nr:hypothetical protein [Candidatus Saccharibacteria bacterium]
MEINEDNQSDKGLDKRTKKHRRNPTVIILALASLLLGFGIAGYLVYESMNQASPEQPAPNTPVKKNEKKVKTNNVAPEINPKEVIIKVKESLSSQYSLANAETSDPGSANLIISESDHSGNWRPEGYGFYVWHSKGAQINATSQTDPEEVQPSEIDKSVRQKAIQVLNELGLKKVDTIGVEPEGSSLDIYKGKGLICSIQPVAAQISTTTLACGREPDFKSEAEKIKPLASAIKDITQNTLLGGLNIKDSKNSGYKLAELTRSDVVEFGGSMALLYKRDGGDWQYVTSTQQVPFCSLFNTEESRSAYAGESCLNDDGTESSVK